jgi:hypothetical protein
MNGVPGVMQLESNPSPATISPAATSAASASARSIALLNRRDRCWFILARGATPSIAMKSRRRGRAIAKRRSKYMKTPATISASVRRVPGSLPWVQLWMMPFMSWEEEEGGRWVGGRRRGRPPRSRATPLLFLPLPTKYRLSISGTRVPSTGWLMRGYRSESQR